MKGAVRGATLLELLVALAVAAVVVVAAVQLLSAGMRAAVTVDQIERLADRARLLHTVLHSEIAPAASAPCGAVAPITDWSGGGVERADQGLPFGGLRAIDNVLHLARFDPDPAAAERRYTAVHTTEADDVVLELGSTLAGWVTPGELLLFGDCTSLHRVGVGVGSGGESLYLAVAADAAEAFPASGWLWRWSDLSADDNPSLTLTQFAHSPQLGVDQQPTLAINGQPIVPGVVALDFTFASCTSPFLFEAAADVVDWRAVCAVRAAAELEVGGEHAAGPRLRWPLTVTVAVWGRLP